MKTIKIKEYIIFTGRTHLKLIPMDKKWFNIVIFLFTDVKLWV